MKSKDTVTNTTAEQQHFDPIPPEALEQRCQVTVAANVLHAIRRHARSSMTAEVCGVLIGEETPEGTLIEAAISGENAAQGGAHVTFTQEAWEHIYGVKDRDYPEKRIVGWYHSHPGFGIFLSRHDTFIHENFFSAPSQVAWVYDPHSEEEGYFGWVGGKLQRLSTVRVVDTNYGSTPDVRDEPEGTDSEDAGEDDLSRENASTDTKGPKVHKLRKRLILLFCMALIFVAGLAAGFLVRPIPVVLYSLPDGRILTEAQAQQAIERALELRRQQLEQQKGGVANSDSPPTSEEKNRP
jgi:proteasome lid subunit RPN8/RPN11